jgi:PhnB protein
MRLSHYLLFNGECEAAFKFYEQILGGKIEGMITYAGSQAEDQVPAEWRDKILHARMTVGDSEIMASDAPPGRYEKPRGFSVTIQPKDSAEGERLFKALAEGGAVQMPFQKTFWSPGFGMCADRFGIPWMVNSDGDS